jgi:alanine-glyoxylate transaminase/serine-glyoxylate transaminase/serine-pyruvate transaminase
MIQEHFNMSCGQTELTPACKRVIGRDVIPIYYPPLWEMGHEALSLWKEFLGTKNDVIIVFGTGTSGVEASLNSILEPGDRFLVARNGMFGEIMSCMVEAAGGVAVRLPFPIGEPVDPAVVASALDKDPSIKGFGVVHGETSVGVTNPIRELGVVARKRGVLFLVDAISSFGSDWGIDLCVVNGQKCLGAPQGNTFVSVSPRAWKVMADRKEKIRGFYMNLRACQDYLTMVSAERQNWAAGENQVDFVLQEAPHPASPSFVLMQGIWASLVAMKEEGLAACIARHETAGRAVRAALRAMDLDVICRDERFADHAVTAVLLPNGIGDYQIRRHLYDRYGVVLGDGNMASWEVFKREVGRSYVRIGTMGEAARYHKVLYAVFSLGMALQDLGAEVDVSSAVRAVQSVYGADGGA